MKSKLLLIILVLFSYTFANAQTSKEIEKAAKAETANMVTALDLTDNQEQFIYRQNYVLINQQARFDKLEEKTDKMVSQMESLKADYKTNIEQHLTDTQRAKFNTWIEKSSLLKK